MAKIDKFGFGGIGFTVKTNGTFPGVRTTDWGFPYIGPGLMDFNVETNATYNYCQGEIVEIIANTDATYVVKPVDANTTTNSALAVIINVTGGQTNTQPGRIVENAPQVTLALYVLKDINMGGVSVVYKDTAQPTVGAQVYLGLGTNDTVAGTVYSTSGAGKIAINNFVFKNLPYAPSSTNAKAIKIGAKLI